MVNLRNNKKGWLKSIEVTIAVLIVLGIILYTSTNNIIREPSIIKRDFSNVIPAFLESIAKNESVRAEILSADENKNDLIEKSINTSLQSLSIREGFDFHLVVTNSYNKTSLQSLGIQSPKGRNVYYYERMISSDTSVTDFKIKKVAIFVWRK